MAFFQGYHKDNAYKKCWKLVAIRKRGLKKYGSFFSVKKIQLQWAMCVELHEYVKKNK